MGMNKKLLFFSFLLSMCSTTMLAVPTEFEIGNTKVSVEFYTPQSVRVVKSLIELVEFH